MAFVIEGQRIAFENYKTLSAYSESIPSVLTIISFLDEWFDAHCTAITVSTSGSTGVPAMLRHKKKAMRYSAQLTQTYFGYKSGDRALLCLPVHFIAGKMMVVRSILSELDLVLVEPGSQIPLKKLGNIDFAPMTVHQFISTYDADPESFIKLDNILLGGGNANKRAMEIVSKIDSEVYLGYGMTETITHIAMRNLSSMENSYKALDGIVLTQGVEGNLIIQAPHLDSLVRTTDRVDFLSENKFVWVGRMDNVINSGGIKISPEPIENRLSEVLSANFFISSKPDELLGQSLTLYIEGFELTMPEDLEEAIRSLKKFQRPREIVYLPEFLYTETGKIRRKHTVAEYLNNL